MRPIDTPAFPARSHRAARLTMLAVALLLLAACGGSGSSGFDAAFLENSAIDRAVDTSMCQPLDGLTICAAGGTPVAPATETPRPTRTATFALTGTPGVIPTPTVTSSSNDVTPSPTTTIASGATASPTITTTPEQPTHET